MGEVDTKIERHSARGAAMTEFIAIAVAVMVFAGILVAVFRNLGNLNRVSSDTVARSLACEISGQRTYRTFSGVTLSNVNAIVAQVADEVYDAFILNGVNSANVAVLAAVCKQVSVGNVGCIPLSESCKIAPCSAANSAAMLTAIQAFAARHAQVIDSLDGVNLSRGAVFEMIAAPLDESGTFVEDNSCTKLVPDGGIIFRSGPSGCGGCGCP